MPGVSLYDLGRKPGAIVTFALDGVDSFEIKEKAGCAALTVSVSRPGSTLLDALAHNLPPLVRTSRHYYNSEAEIDALVEALNALV